MVRLSSSAGFCVVHLQPVLTHSVQASVASVVSWHLTLRFLPVEFVRVGL